MPRNICHIVKAFGNKNQTYTKDLLELLNTTSNDNHFVFCHRLFVKTDRITVFTIKQYNRIQFLLIHLKLYTFDSDYRDLSKVLPLSVLQKWIVLCINKPDILHLHHMHAIPLPLLRYFKCNKVKVIMSLRGRDLLIDTQNETQQILLKQKLSLADIVHNISAYMSTYLKDQLHIESKVIYRGQELPKAKNIKTDFDKTDVIRLIAVGRLEWVKGHIYSIESVHRLRQKGYNVTLDIYGDGSLKEYFNYRINQLELQDSISLKGHLDNKELKEHYKNYDVALQPSLSEALSNGLVDLMMHNLPCVITNVGGMPEVIVHQKSGVVISVNDMVALDNAILEANSMNFDELRLHNETHKKQFSRDVELKEFNKLYNAV
ncbi:glycosyltransferase family 4 protein [uncultured Winogradskyella sp.]|uniref:glycosyltransferase family 4 protein n=1 Tax=uncultured Winogradskyella sp. TaxID=395353 RepID=UPI0026352C82|nr:glycosyltransferase family 4 protein [uncultured Winogradskyella sp.]